ncbi:unnamed protein product [Toxocara canis]|uniref:Fibronectin type-III domain-containing protein n=1 Tax=Toxocara canis TaxID=6265 RepID=A0A3P7GG80_TOXCA|nr:unnamed protein product [Toxocara canis]
MRIAFALWLCGTVDAFTVLPYVQIDFVHYFRLAQCEAKCAQKYAFITFQYGASTKRLLHDGTFIEFVAITDDNGRFCQLGCHRRRTFSKKASRSVRKPLEDGAKFWSESSAHAGLSGASPVSMVRVGCMNVAPSEGTEFEDSIQGTVFIEMSEHNATPIRFIVQWKQRVYVRSIFEESGWITASIEPEPWFKVEGMVPNVQYRFLVTAVGPDGRLGSPVMSDWAEALSLGLILRPPAGPLDITPKYDSENGVCALVSWSHTPALHETVEESSHQRFASFDSCHYRVTYTNSTHQKSANFVMDSGAGYLLSHLEFSCEYSVSLSALPAAPNDSLSGSSPLEERFITLACNEVFGSGSLNCPPEPVHRLRVQVLPNGTADVMWTPSSDHSAILVYQLFYHSLTDQPDCLREAVSLYLNATSTSARIQLAGREPCEYVVRLINYDLIGRDAVAEARIWIDKAQELIDYLEGRYKEATELYARYPLKSNGSPGRTMPNEELALKINLPPTALPKFDGDPLEFRSYWDQLDSLVNRHRIPDVTKFTHLLVALRGKARAALEGLPVTNTSYAEAVDILHRRFEVKNVVRRALYVQIHNLPRRDKGMDSVGRLTQSFDKICRQLRALGEDPDHPATILSIEQKLSPHVQEIRGKYIVTSRNTSGYVFLGIPYAEPPLGKLRYRAPRAVRPWKGVIEVKQYRNSCLWNSSITSNIAEFTRMSEDCLTVNVFTNAKCLLKGKCAVVYMIHGGDYNFDSPMLYPVDFLVDNFAPEERSVIVVTVTYRLGSFGFLNLSPNLKSSAVKNIGLLDMIEGLRWVQKEISNLGGDPNRVTVMGHSSGAVNAHQLTVSPLTKGLFNQAIIMSGLLGIPTPPNNGQRVSEQFAIKAGCADEKFDDRDAKTVEAVLDCLRKINGKKLLAIQRLIEDDGFTFQGPCVDGPGGVLPKTVEELMKTARPIKMMIGTVEKEMQNTDYLLCKDGSVDRKGVKATCAAVTAMFGYRKKREASRTCTQEYVKPYKTPYIVDDPGFFVNAALYSEALIGAGGRVFLYQFNYANVGDAFYLGPLVPKYTQAQTPHHTQEFVYIVGIHMGNFTEKDEIIRVKFSQLLIDFVNKGDPSSSTEQRWTELRPEIMNYFVIDFDEQNKMPGMKYAYHAHEIKFWNKTMLR